MHGVLLLHKPKGMSSFKALRPVKRLLPKKWKVGHTGTLDPFADGLLVVVIGAFTKLASAVLQFPKTYQAVIMLGRQTDTLDPEGTVEKTMPVPESALQTRHITDTLKAFQGRITQSPPTYSAIHIDGQRAYKRAREGQQFDMPEREVYIHDIQYVSNDQESITIEVTCSSGTYIRSLARDISAHLGTCGYLSHLTRTRVGPFSLESAVSPHSLEHGMVDFRETVLNSSSVYSILTSNPVITLGDNHTTAFSMGKDIDTSWFVPSPSEPGTYGVYTRDNQLAGQICLSDTGMVKYDFVTLKDSHRLSK